MAAATKMILYSDRISHPARACLLTLKRTNLAFEEKQNALLTGAYMKNKELPFRKIPVLADGDFKVAESTTILRYIANKAGDTSLYSNDVKQRAKVDECLDFWQSTLNAQVLRIVQNTLFFKLMFRLKEPNMDLIKEATKKHSQDRKLFQSYFLKGKPFVAGDNASIADLMMAVTFEQSAVAGVELGKETDFVDRVKAEFPDYDLMHQEVRALPDTLRKMKML